MVSMEMTLSALVLNSFMVRHAQLTFALISTCHDDQEHIQLAQREALSNMA